MKKNPKSLKMYVYLYEDLFPSYLIYDPNVYRDREYLLQKDWKYQEIETKFS